MKRPVCENVTPVAAGVARSFLQENWLDLSSKKLEIKGVGCVGTRCCVGRRSRLCAVPDPVGRYFPLGLTLRSTVLRSRLAGLAVCLFRHAVQHPAALSQLGG